MSLPIGMLPNNDQRLPQVWTQDNIAQRMQQDWLARVQALKNQSSGYKMPGGNEGRILYQPRDYSLSESVAPTSPTQQAVTSNPGLNAAFSASASAGSGTSGDGSGMTSDNFVIKPGKYYSDRISSTDVAGLIKDPASALGYWSDFYNMGDPYGNRISSLFNVPQLLQAMGVGGTQLAGTNALDWYGRLADQLSGRNRGQDAFVDPISIAANIFNTPRAGLSSGAGELSVSINNPNLQPEQQIANVAQFVLGSMQGVMTDDQLNAYSQILDQYARQYQQDWREAQRQNGLANFPTFLEYVRNLGGQYGGLF